MSTLYKTHRAAVVCVRPALESIVPEEEEEEERGEFDFVLPTEKMSTSVLQTVFMIIGSMEVNNTVVMFRSRMKNV